MRVSSFRDWLDSIIFQETSVSKGYHLKLWAYLIWIFQLTESGASGGLGSAVPRSVEGLSRESASVMIPSLAMEDRTVVMTSSRPDPVVVCAVVKEVTF